MLLGYGRCSNGTAGLPAGHTGWCCRPATTASPCCSAPARYLREFSGCPGTYYYTRGWIEYIDDPYHEYLKMIPRYGEEKARKIAQLIIANYCAWRSSTPAPTACDYDEYVRTVCEFYDLPLRCCRARCVCSRSSSPRPARRRVHHGRARRGARRASFLGSVREVGARRRRTEHERPADMTVRCGPLTRLQDAMTPASTSSSFPSSFWAATTSIRRWWGGPARRGAALARLQAAVDNSASPVSSACPTCATACSSTRSPSCAPAATRPVRQDAPLPRRERALHAGLAFWTGEIAGWQCGVMVCYEIAFPEVARALALSGARLLIVPAAFGKSRVRIWQIATVSRAIENGCYLAAAGHAGGERHLWVCRPQPRGRPLGRAAGRRRERAEMLVVELRSRSSTRCAPGATTPTPHSPTAGRSSTGSDRAARGTRRETARLGRLSPPPLLGGAFLRAAAFAAGLTAGLPAAFLVAALSTAGCSVVAAPAGAFLAGLVGVFLGVLAAVLVFALSAALFACGWSIGASPGAVWTIGSAGCPPAVVADCDSVSTGG